jgi:cell division protein FtsA
VVLTGGAGSLYGAADLGERIFELPVQVGVPKGFGGLMDSIKNPSYATGIGLIHYGLKHREKDRSLIRINKSNSFEKIFERMKRWFEDFF